MRRLGVVVGVGALLASLAVIGAPASPAAEGCAAISPHGSTKINTCTYEATANGAIIAMSNNWKVTITTKGKKPVTVTGDKPTYHSSMTDPKIKPGDKVVAETAGGVVVVGTGTAGNNVVLPKP